MYTKNIATYLQYKQLGAWDKLNYLANIKNPRGAYIVNMAQVIYTESIRRNELQINARGFNYGR